MSSATGSEPVPVPPTDTESTEALTMSETSRSATLSVPLPVRPALASSMASAAESPLSTVITGASFVPLIVMVTCWVFELPVPSLATTS